MLDFFLVMIWILNFEKYFFDFIWNYGFIELDIYIGNFV